MKIGFIASSFGVGGGWSLYSKGVIESVSKMPGTFVVVLVNKNSPNILRQDIVLYQKLPTHVTFSPWSQFQIFLQCLKYFKGCDIIHLCYERPMIGAALASRFLKAKLVLTLHGTYALPPSGHSFKNFIKRELMRFAYATAALTTTGSFNTEEKVREIIPELPECRFIPNGYDSAVFYRRANVLDSNTILSIGWLKNRKGFDVVIDALGILKDEFPNLKLKIIGGDDDTPELPYYQFLEQKIKENNLTGRVEIRVGKISREEIAMEYNTCSVFILASRDSGGHFEGFPLVYMEALSCGAPVVTTRGYGSEYAVKDGVQGFLISQDDSRGAAEAIRKIVGNPALHAAMRKNALTQAAKHTWDVIAPQLIQLYADAKNKNSKKK